MTGKKKFLLSISILVFIVVCIGFYMYNKGAIDVQNITGKKVSAEELYNVFLTDSAIAKKEYAGNILEVAGEIAKISKNQQNQDIILLKTAVAGASVNCTMQQTGIKIKPAGNIIIKGICSGIGQGDEDLGILGDVYLLRCYIAN